MRASSPRARHLVSYPLPLRERLSYLASRYKYGWVKWALTRIYRQPALAEQVVGLFEAMTFERESGLPFIPVGYLESSEAAYKEEYTRLTGVVVAI